MLFVGQLIRGKGVDLLLSAMAASRRGWSLDIVGEGNARPRLERLSGRLGLDGRVRFHGWVRHEDLGALHERARAAVVPSRWLEDGKIGFLVDEQDVAGLAAALDRLAEDLPLARQMGLHARDSVARRFSFEDFVDGLERFLSP